MDVLSIHAGLKEPVCIVCVRSPILLFLMYNKSFHIVLHMKSLYIKSRKKQKLRNVSHGKVYIAANRIKALPSNTMQFW